MGQLIPFCVCYLNLSWDENFMENHDDVISYLCRNAAISLRQLLHCQQALKDIFKMTYIIALIKYERLEWPSQHLYVNNDTVV